MSTGESTSPRRIALVTSSSAALVEPPPLELAPRGYFVLVNYVSDAQSAEATLAAITASGGKGALLQFDVSDYNATQSAVMKAQKELVQSKCWSTTLASLVMECS